MWKGQGVSPGPSVNLLAFYVFVRLVVPVQGELAEWLKATVLKTAGLCKQLRGFESLTLYRSFERGRLPRQLSIFYELFFALKNQKAK